MNTWKKHIAWLGIIITITVWIWVIYVGAQTIQTKDKVNSKPPGPTYNYWYPQNK